MLKKKENNFLNEIYWGQKVNIISLRLKPDILSVSNLLLSLYFFFVIVANVFCQLVLADNSTYIFGHKTFLF